MLVLGGRGLVTVWATEQEDPAKTINKWKKLQDGESPGEQQQHEECLGQQRERQKQQQGQLIRSQQDVPVTGPDYLVPWNVPLHRAGDILQQQQQQRGDKQASAAAAAAGGRPINSSTEEGSTAAAAVSSVGASVDRSKGTVVLQRYYHLFEQGELEGLVAQVPGVTVVDAFYDRSNWCVVFERQV